MSMTAAQRASVVQNVGIGPQIIQYIKLHSVAPGNHALTYAAMCRHFGWDANNPVNGATIATFCASIKAGVDTLQSS